MATINPESRFEKLREAAVQERIRNRLERRFFSSIRAALNNHAKELANAYAVGAFSQVVATNSEKRLEQTMQSLYTVSVEAAKKHTQKALPQKAGVALVERKDTEGEINRLLQLWITTRTANKVRKITDTTKAKVREIISTAVAEGLNERQVAKEITKKLRRVNRWRARTIARTETHAAMQNTGLEVVKNLPSRTIEMKEWVSVEDNRTRHTHNEADGTKIPLNEAFNVNGSPMHYPGDPSGPAGEVINCRCVLVYSEGGLHARD